MDNRLNNEDIQMLIPDYITGHLSDSEKLQVEHALSESEELRVFCDEMKQTLSTAASVKFEEPPANYFNSLLPRIHEKIDAGAEKKFSWSGISAIWKIIVPVAAVILVFLVYELAKLPENQISKNETKEVKENVNKDTVGNSKNSLEEKKEKVPEIKEDKIANDNSKVPTSLMKKNTDSKQKNLNTADNELNQDNKSSEDIKENIQSEEYASIDTDDIAVFASNSDEGIDEETEGELNKLGSNEKDQLIEDLLQSNL